MNREDIIRMAREAGMQGMLTDVVCTHEELERFAALVAAAEREKVAAWMIQRSYATGHGDTTEELLKELDWQIHERIAAEREACLNCYSPDDTATDWIDKIRARGQ